MLTIIAVQDSGKFTGWINFTKKSIYYFQRCSYIILFNYKGENSNFTLEKPGRHQLNQVTEVDNASNGINEHSKQNFRQTQIEEYSKNF